MEGSGACGSQGPPRLLVYLTGFGPFGNVSDNPSATLVKHLAAALGSEQRTSSSPLQEKNSARPVCSSRTGEGLRISRESLSASALDPSTVGSAATERLGLIELCGWEVLEVSAEAATEAVPRIHSALRRKSQKKRLHASVADREYSVFRENQEKNEKAPTDAAAADRKEEARTLVLHFGVSMQNDSWRLEMSAKNDARFPCRDARGCRPASDVISDCIPLEASLRSSLCLESVAAELSRQGLSCSVSEDAGCFVCNFLYFKSLQEGQSSGVTSLFVHIPPFSAINLEQQLAAALDLLALLARKELPQN